MLSKIFATFYPQMLIATSFYLQAGPAYQVHVDQSVKPESPTLPLPRCWRIEGIPEKWSKDELIESLQTLDESLKELESDRLSLYPACWGKFKTGLLRPKLSLKFFDDLKTDDTNIITIYTRDAKSGEIIEVDLSIDCLFYGLTPLNDPKGKIIIDVVAVTGLAGHAFESWRNRRSSPRMWLQDFLPLDIEENIRILTYGYNSSLKNEGQRRILDYRRNLVQSLTNARKDVPLRPIVFVGHSLGCTVITQALLQSRDSLRDQYILQSTRSVIFFGAPHQGLNVDSLMAMVENMSEGKKSTRLQLLRQLQEDSEFMEDQKERLVHIWKNLKIISFYETEHTSTVRRSAAGKWERGGEAIQMVKETSSQLYLPQEERYPIWGNHSSIAKFTKRTDESYTTVVNHIEQCVENEKIGEEAIGRWIVSHGKRL